MTKRRSGRGFWPASCWGECPGRQDAAECWLKCGTVCNASKSFTNMKLHPFFAAFSLQGLATERTRSPSQRCLSEPLLGGGTSTSSPHDRTLPWNRTSTPLGRQRSDGRSIASEIPTTKRICCFDKATSRSVTPVGRQRDNGTQRIFEPVETAIVTCFP